MKFVKFLFPFMLVFASILNAHQIQITKNMYVSSDFYNSVLEKSNRYLENSVKDQILKGKALTKEMKEFINNSSKDMIDDLVLMMILEDKINSNAFSIEYKLSVNLIASNLNSKIKYFLESFKDEFGVN